MKILVVVAHPDDECLGMGGTIAKLSKDNTIEVLVLGTGVASRNIQNKHQVIMKLREESRKANKILGTKKIYFEDFPDNEFDKVSLLTITKVIENYIGIIKPNIIYTHHQDLNIDHEIVHRAVITAARPMGNYSVEKIYTFEVLSSTEWCVGNAFKPNVYMDITDVFKFKLQAMQTYNSELRIYPHPRSIEGITILAEKRGLEVSLKYVEAFFLIRSIER